MIYIPYIVLIELSADSGLSAVSPTCDLSPSYITLCRELTHELENGALSFWQSGDVQSLQRGPWQTVKASCIPLRAPIQQKTPSVWEMPATQQVLK